MKSQAAILISLLCCQFCANKPNKKTIENNGDERRHFLEEQIIVIRQDKQLEFNIFLDGIEDSTIMSFLSDLKIAVTKQIREDSMDIEYGLPLWTMFDVDGLVIVKSGDRIEEILISSDNFKIKGLDIKLKSPKSQLNQIYRQSSNGLLTLSTPNLRIDSNVYLMLESDSTIQKLGVFVL